jgi:hypothetical protein
VLGLPVTALSIVLSRDLCFFVCVRMEIELNTQQEEEVRQHPHKVAWLLLCSSGSRGNVQ